MKSIPIHIQKGNLQWTYKGESWSSSFGGSMVLRRIFINGSYTVERKINGWPFGKFEGLTIEESTKIIDGWLEPSRDEPEIDEYLSGVELRKMQRIL